MQMRIRCINMKLKREGLIKKYGPGVDNASIRQRIFGRRIMTAGKEGYYQGKNPRVAVQVKDSKPQPQVSKPQPQIMIGQAPVNPILSVLICSLHNRKASLDKLLERLIPQMNAFTEVIIAADNGEISIGAKRNKLLDSANGEYICYIDDDDLVSENYISRILKALEAKPDCVGIEGMITVGGKNPKKFLHSIRYQVWEEKDGVYLRYPNHLNPIKKLLALQARFTQKNHGEDADYSDRVKPLLKTEVYLDEPIYFYNS